MPFVLLWIYAEYPIHAENLSGGLDRLYTLLQKSKLLKEHYDRKLQFDVSSAEVHPISDVELPPSDAVSTISLRHAWDRRVKMLVCVIACHHCSQK